MVSKNLWNAPEREQGAAGRLQKKTGKSGPEGDTAGGSMKADFDLMQAWEEYERGLSFNDSINLDDTVEVNENFFIGKQWEGVESNGLPTPVFNFLKRVTLFQIASVTTDNIKMQASPLAYREGERVSEATAVVNREFERLFEFNNIGSLLREYMRNAAVNGDGCLYTYWDAEQETGQAAKGAIVTEIVENTRVFFGNPRDRRVQRQPYIMISSRQMLNAVKKRAEKNGSPDWEEISPDSDERDSRPGLSPDACVTSIIKFWRNEERGTVWACEFTRTALVKPPWDTGLKCYPITWLNWDYVQDCYHGQAMITGLIPNQIFINKLFAMSMISLMTTAYPKIIYDKNRVKKWDSRVGAAIPVNGGDVNSVARIMDPATISPQISQFIDLAINYTQTFLGATNAAMGEGRADNTSAIIALQRAANIPTEITKQNLYQSIEDLGRIYIDFMGTYYGERIVGEKAQAAAGALGGKAQAGGESAETFDFDTLRDIPMHLKLDVGASAYWSEIANMQTLDNLLMQGRIELVDYLERIPDGYISKKHELIEKIKAQQEESQGGMEYGEMPQMELPSLGGGMPGGEAAAAGAGPMPMGLPPETATGPDPVTDGYEKLKQVLNGMGAAIA